jgi:hypothetical protein
MLPSYKVEWFREFIFQLYILFKVSLFTLEIYYEKNQGHTAFQEERNKFPISEPAELFVLPTKSQ